MLFALVVAMGLSFGMTAASASADMVPGVSDVTVTQNCDKGDDDKGSASITTPEAATFGGSGCDCGDKDKGKDNASITTPEAATFGGSGCDCGGKDKGKDKGKDSA
jgi:hypothetical protein